MAMFNSYFDITRGYYIIDQRIIGFLLDPVSSKNSRQKDGDGDQTPIAYVNLSVSNFGLGGSDLRLRDVDPEVMWWWWLQLVAPSNEFHIMSPHAKDAKVVATIGCT